MPLPILPRPPLPQGLADAATLGSLVPFVGAGVSRLGDCPSWVEFADKALDALVAKKALSAAQRSQLGSLSPRVKLSVAQLTAREAGETLDFKSMIQTKANWREHSEGRKVYGSISALGRRFITTNYDEWLDVVMPRLDISAVPDPPSSSAPVIGPLSAPQAGRNDSSGIRCGGRSRSPSRFRARTHWDGAEYQRLHQPLRPGPPSSRLRRQPAPTFLEYVFRNKTVLFLGYGLEELEILEYIILRESAKRGPSEAAHFALQGFFSFESALCDAMAATY